MTPHNHEQWPHCQDTCSSSKCAEMCQAGVCPGLHRFEQTEDGYHQHVIDPDERPWFEGHVTFEAISKADAEYVMERIAEAICRGHGEGEDHQCKFQFVVSGPMEIELAEDADE